MAADDSTLLARAQDAVEATATAYAVDGSVDVDERLVAELDARAAWPSVGADVVPVLAHYIRSGHPVSLYLDGDDRVAVNSVPGAEEGAGSSGG
jgi:hypothetical protein